MKVALLQMDVAWHQPEVNLTHISSQIRHIDADLLILPEMFLSGFSMDPAKVALNWPEDKFISELKRLSKEYNTAITGSLAVKENGLFRNRMLFIHPNGNLDYYDKRHLFSLAGESEIYQRGEDRTVVCYMGWNILLQICYDLRFPVFSAQRSDHYDLIVYVASWPNKRIKAWNGLLKARAIENMSYVVGVNRIGVDANGYEYSGSSRAYDELGKKQLDLKSDSVFKILNLDKEKMDKNRNRLGFLEDQDDFNLLIP